MESQYFVPCKEGDNAYVRILGLPSVYIPSFSINYQDNFDEKTNTFNLETPIT